VTVRRFTFRGCFFIGAKYPLSNALEWKLQRDLEIETLKQSLSMVARDGDWLRWAEARGEVDGMLPDHLREAYLRVMQGVPCPTS
jgi:hypothetical protein